MTLPPAGPPPGQPWPPQWPPNTPPQKRGPSWPVAVIVAAILITGGAVAVALINKSGPAAPNAAGPSAAPNTSVQPTTASVENTATCKAWRTTSAAFDAIPHLPDGWDWDTPNIDTLSSNQKIAVDKALGIFESKIAPNDPQQVVSAAHAYVAAKRTELSHLASHTITEADGTAVDSMNQLCTL